MSKRSATPPYEIVRSSCGAFQSDRVIVDRKAAMTLAKELDVQMVKEFGSNLANDANFTGSACTFDSVDDEAAFILLLHALDFGSGWRLHLHNHHGKGAFLSIKPGVEKYYNDHHKLSSTELMNSTKEEIAKAFAFEGNAELDDLATLLHRVIVELGTNTQQYGSLSCYITKKIEAASKKETPAGEIVWDLIESFPETFDDFYIIDNQQVCLYKKARWSVNSFIVSDRKMNAFPSLTVIGLLLILIT